MRFGYVTPNSWGFDTPQQVIDLAVQAEDLGVDSLWVSHHVLHRGFVADRLENRRPYHDPLVMLAAFATATSRARLGTSVLVVPYLHPMPTAKTLATVDHLSDGRVDVGVGSGRCASSTIRSTRCPSSGAAATATSSSRCCARC